MSNSANTQNTQKLGNWTDSPCYYVSVKDGPKNAFVAGPFRAHSYALSALTESKNIGMDKDPWASFYAWGTARYENGYIQGSLNRFLRESHPEIERREWSE